MLLKLNKILDEHCIDAILVTNYYNIRYLSKFTGTSSLLLILHNKMFFFTDFRYMEQANKEIINKNIQIIKIKNSLYETVIDYLNNAKVKKLGIEFNNLTIDKLNKIKDSVETEVFDISTNLNNLRKIKENYEIDIIKKSVEIAENALSEVIKEIKPGVTEKYIADRLEYLMKLNGATDRSFDTIVASNERSAMPHGVASPKIIVNEGFVKIDFGCYYKGYVSDITRTFYFGDNPSDKHLEIYNIVKEAQEMALNAVKEGIKISDLDKIARDYIESKGFGDNYGHGLGHGIGLEIHELPAVNGRNDEVLKENMVITIEPGIYIEGFGGVRIEDDVVVKKDGYEVLTRFTKELIKIN